MSHLFELYLTMYKNLIKKYVSYFIKYHNSNSINMIILKYY